MKNKGLCLYNFVKIIFFLRKAVKTIKKFAQVYLKIKNIEQILTLEK